MGKTKWRLVSPRSSDVRLAVNAEELIEIVVPGVANVICIDISISVGIKLGTESFLYTKDIVYHLFDSITVIVVWVAVQDTTCH